MTGLHIAGEELILLGLPPHKAVSSQLPTFPPRETGPWLVVQPGSRTVPHFPTLRLREGRAGYTGPVAMVRMLRHRTCPLQGWGEHLQP